MRYRFFIVFFICLGFLPFQTKAAELYFGAPAPTLPPQVPFEIGVFLNTQDGPANAIEGELSYPADTFSFFDTFNRGSLINLWIEPPQAPAACTNVCTMRFSGIIPGGFQGKQGYLFSVVLNPIKEGKGVIDIHQEKILAHDGKGTELKATVAPLTLTIKSGAKSEAYAPVKDTDPPEPFALVVTQDPNIFDNKPFLVFTTQDKGRGMDYYEVREAWIGSLGGRFRRAESPYQLEHPWRLGRITVRAIDRAGNIRTEILPGRLSWWWILLPFVLVILGYVVLRKRSRSSFS